jgi:hypothetical protein
MRQHAQMATRARGRTCWTPQGGPGGADENRETDADMNKQGTVTRKRATYDTDDGEEGGLGR